ncbi:monodehydroascorbate reductase 5 [Cucumis melo var. makuwa]|uniref:Monodehydroascorbate reductase 5 n=1 Tax=Cucumis melo var. makuwa TaxID=1194695 RepID=A0A5D3DTT1_CUCMM|nr:monodehydroascorbate reductase 5 [Cucumis melo var. makuwa]
MTAIQIKQLYDRVAQVEHVDHARRSAQHCVKALLTAQTQTVFEFEGSPRKIWWQFFGDNVGETIEIWNFDLKIATFWIDSGKLKGVLESGSPEVPKNWHIFEHVQHVIPEEHNWSSVIPKEHLGQTGM